MHQSLYEKYGGDAAVTSIARDFYQRVLSSAALRGYFEGVQMERLLGHQIKFLSKVMGGPDAYAGRSLEKAHRRLRIDDDAFDEVAQCLRDALAEAGVEDTDLQSILRIVASVRRDIVHQPQYSY